MFELMLFATAITSCFAIIGIPLVLGLAVSEGRSRVVSSLLMAPACGMSLYMGASVWLHFSGVSGRIAFILMLGLSTTGIALIFKLRKISLSGSLLIGAITAIVAVAAIGTLLNGFDFRGMLLNDYFPLTNDDTFAYLGHIDQIRIVGWNEPTLSYPAGYYPLYTFERLPGVALIADLANTFQLETHEAFFLVQHMSIVVIGLAAAGLSGWITNSIRAAILCLLLSVCGNFMLHQSLQQFNSSMMGGVIAVPLLWLAAWTLPKLALRLEGMIGVVLTGSFAGIMAMASPEAYPLYLVALGLIFILTLAAWRQWSTAILIPLFLASFAFVSLPFLSRIWSFTLAQTIGGQRGPGSAADWIAVPAILVQYSGVRLIVGDKLLDYPNLVVAATLLFTAVSVIAIAFLLKITWSVIRKSRLNDLPIICIAIPCLVFFVAQIIFYLMPRGYYLLKAIDYSTFLQPIAVTVAASIAFAKFTRARRELIFVGLAIAALWFPVACNEKYKTLDRYRLDIAATPKPEKYRIQSSDAVSNTMIYPDLKNEVLNEFLYINRFGPNKILLLSSASNRFQPVVRENRNPELVARLARIGSVGHPIADITDKMLNPNIEGLQLLPAGGQVLIQRGGGWLDPEGPSISTLFRWLGRFGDFVVVGNEGVQKSELRVDLGPGPDLLPTNTIEIVLGDKVLATLPAIQKRTMVHVSLPELAGPPVTGTIRITGPQAGPRQLSVVSIGTALLNVAR